MVDQRSFKRFKVKNRAFTTLSDNSCPYHAALILDMSSKGMSFSYFGKKPINETVNKLDISYEDGLCLDDLPVKIISDISLQRKKIPTRRCGVKFVDLTPDQQTSIEDFIKIYKESSI